jgi:hypothetical protein
MPLAVQPKPQFGHLGWGAGAVLCGAVWTWFVGIGFGDLRSDFALGSLIHRGVHVLLGATLCFCVLRAYSLSWRATQIPFGSGHYLFPFGVVTAKASKLLEFDATDVESVRAEGTTILIGLRSAGTIKFPVPSAADAEKLSKTFQDAQTKWKALQTAEPLERARLCPLMESGVPNPLAPTDSYLRTSLMPPAVFFGGIVVGALILGVGVFSARDSMSRKALYRAATEENSVSGYLAYLERGGTRGEVKQLLLPRAELQEAIAVGTVDAIEEFKAKDPELQIGGEVQNALRVALLRELDKAVKVGSLTALDEVPKRFKSHQLIAGEIAAVRQKIFQKVFADFQAQATDKLRDIVPFVQGLLAHSQEHGSTVELRFVHEFPQTPDKLDQVVAKSKKYYMGSKSLPTQYFLGEPSRRREDDFLKKMQKRLQAAFPKDILEFKIGPPANAENVEAPAVDVPTLTFSHRERLSGGFVGGKPKAMYLGAAILMGVEGTLPKQDEPMVVLKWNAWRSPNFEILSDKTKDISDVYEEMMSGTFDGFLEIYLGRWFKEP